MYSRSVSLLQLIVGLPQVEACAVCLYEASRLVSFVVASTCGDQRAASPSEQHLVEETAAAVSPLSSVTQLQGRTGGADGDLRRLILKQLSLLLPSHCVPDTVVLVPSLCVTPHGER